MAEEKKETWLTYLALTTVILAVSATLATFQGQKYSTQTVRSEINAANRWSQYQAKKIRAYMVEGQKESVESELKWRGAEAPREVVEDLQRRIAKYAAKLDEWKTETEEIAQIAKGFESTRDNAVRHQKWFGLAVIFLQIAILLSSVAALMKQKTVWVVGLIVGVLGIICFVNGFVLFYEM